MTKVLTNEDPENLQKMLHVSTQLSKYVQEIYQQIANDVSSLYAIDLNTVVFLSYTVNEYFVVVAI